MKNLITSDNLTFTKKKCNCGLNSNTVDTKDTKDTNINKKTVLKKYKSKKRKTKSRYK